MVFRFDRHRAVSARQEETDDVISPLRATAAPQASPPVIQMFECW